MGCYLTRKENTSPLAWSWRSTTREGVFNRVVIVIHFSLSVKQYAQAESCPGRALKLPERCPHPDCQATDSLVRWGTYHRWACTETGDYRLSIQRLRCTHCGRTHSLLPDFLHPFRHYVLELLHQVVWLYLIVGLGFGQVLNRLPDNGPAPATVREWVQAFAYGAGYLLLAAVSRELLTLDLQVELPGPAPPQLTAASSLTSNQPIIAGSWPSSSMPWSKNASPGFILPPTNSSLLGCIGCKLRLYPPVFSGPLA